MLTNLVVGLVLAGGIGGAWAQSEPKIPIPENLVADGIPAIAASVAETAGRYVEFRSSFTIDWHPRRRELLVSTAFANTDQLHNVAMPGGARRQLTFFTEPVRTGSYHPAADDYLVFSKDTGGSERYQLFRYDLATRNSTLLTDGKSRNDMGPWSSSGDRIAYTSTRRNGRDSDLYVMNPADAKSDRLAMQAEGGGWAPLELVAGRFEATRPGIYLVERDLPVAGRRRHGCENYAYAPKSRNSGGIFVRSVQ